MSHTVLIVDDEPVILDVLAQLLALEGYEVRRASNGRRAVDAIASDPPDLVLSDMMMPEMSGMELTNYLRNQGSHIPVILMSATYADVRLPGVQFLSKPFDIDHVLQQVARSIES